MRPRSAAIAACREELAAARRSARDQGRTGENGCAHSLAWLEAGPRRQLNIPRAPLLGLDPDPPSQDSRSVDPRTAVDLTAGALDPNASSPPGTTAPHQRRNSSECLDRKKLQFIRRRVGHRETDVAAGRRRFTTRPKVDRPRCCTERHPPRKARWSRRRSSALLRGRPRSHAPRCASIAPRQAEKVPEPERNEY